MPLAPRGICGRVNARALNLYYGGNESKGNIDELIIRFIQHTHITFIVRKTNVETITVLCF